MRQDAGGIVMTEWIAQHKLQRDLSGYVIGRHHPKWLQLDEAVRQPVVDHWVSEYQREKQMPPGLVAGDGLMVDGNHRLAAVRQFGQGMWCCLVEWRNGWQATGGAVWVR